jgi:ParB family chromosome partitioning protein
MARKAFGFDVKNLVAADNTTSAISMKLHESNDLSGEGKVQAIMLDSVIPNRFNPRNLPKKIDVVINEFLAVDSKDSFSDKKELLDQIIKKNHATDDQDVYDHVFSLAEHIAQHGMMSPILVTPVANDKYEVVAGERRYWASRLIGRKVIRAAIRHLDERQHRVLSISENLAREGLSLKEQVIALSQLQSLDEQYFKHLPVQQSFGISRRRAFALLKCTKEPYFEQVMNGALTNVNHLSELDDAQKVHPVHSVEKVKTMSIKFDDAKLLKVAKLLNIDVDANASAKDVKKALEAFLAQL